MSNDPSTTPSDYDMLIDPVTGMEINELHLMRALYIYELEMFEQRINEYANGTKLHPTHLYAIENIIEQIKELEKETKRQIIGQINDAKKARKT